MRKDGWIHLGGLKEAGLEWGGSAAVGSGPHDRLVRRGGCVVRGCPKEPKHKNVIPLFP
jgi:ribosomal protein L36